MGSQVAGQQLHDHVERVLGLVDGVKSGKVGVAVELV
jgi:hypothetical protein